MVGMQIVVVAVSGDQLAVLENADPAWTFADIKAHVPRCSSILDGKVWLAHGSTMLTGRTSLADAGVEDESVLTLVRGPVPTLLLSSSDHSASVLDICTDERIRSFYGHEEGVNTAICSRGGEQVLTASDDHSARLWDAATGEVLRVFEGHNDCIKSACFSPDGRLVLTASDDGTARVWDVDSGECRGEIGDDATNSMNSAVFSPDGLEILGSIGPEARIWNLRTRRPTQRFVGHSDIVFSAVYSPCGEFVLTTSLDRTAKLWRAQSNTRKLLRTYKGQGNTCPAVFSPNGEFIVVSSDRAARVCSPLDGATLLRVSQESPSVTAVAFSPDSEILVTASVDRKIKLWSTTTGECLQTLEAHRSGVINSVVVMN